MKRIVVIIYFCRFGHFPKIMWSQRQWMWVMWNIYQQISTNIHQEKNTKESWDNYINSLQYGRKQLWKFFIFMDLELFLFYFVMSSKCCGSSSYLWKFIHVPTILSSPKHLLCVMIKGNWFIWTNINTETIHKILYRTTYSIIYKMGEKYCDNTSYLWGWNHVNYPL